MKTILFIFSLFVSTISFSQTYTKHKTLDNTAIFQKTSANTATLKFENEDGYVVTKNCTNRRETAEGLTYMVGNGDYITIVKNPWAAMNNPFLPAGTVAFDISFYNSLDRKLWTCTVYPE